MSVQAEALPRVSRPASAARRLPDEVFNLETGA